MGAEIFDDYDAGMLNDYGGGNVGWWQGYVRNEIHRSNEFWRKQIKAYFEEKEKGKENG